MSKQKTAPDGTVTVTEPKTRKPRTSSDEIVVRKLKKAITDAKFAYDVLVSRNYTVMLEGDACAIPVFESAKKSETKELK